MDMTQWTFVAVLMALWGLSYLPSPRAGRARGGKSVKETFDGLSPSHGQNDVLDRARRHTLRKTDAEDWRRNWLGLPSSRRARREVYGTDDRQVVGEYYIRRHPFSAIVRVSPGCTGVLVSRHHVLTAAHCLYDLEAKSFRKNIRVGVPIPEGKRRIPQYLRVLRVPERAWPEAVFFQLHEVLRLNVPNSWTSNFREAALDDFGLITLKRTSCIKKPYLKPQGFPNRSFRSLVNLGDLTLSFGAYEDDYPRGTLTYRTCNIERVDHYSLLYLRCDAAPGSSGAGVYSHIAVVRNGRQTTRRRLIGIFSGNRAHPEQSRDGTYLRYNVAIGLTPTRMRHICRWAPELCHLPDWQDRKGVKLWVLGCKAKKPTARSASTTAPTTAARALPGTNGLPSTTSEQLVTSHADDASGDTA